MHIPMCRVKLNSINVSGNIMSVAKCIRTGVAVLGVLFLTDTAQAADLYGGYGGYKDQPYPPPYPAPLWTGFYMGGHFGGVWSNVSAADNAIFLAPNITVISNDSISTSGIFGGSQFGYNLQAGNFVYGMEADIGGMDNNGSTAFAFNNHTMTVSTTGGFYGDITARTGYAFENALFYAKGGFAFFTGNVKVSDPLDGISQNSGTLTGWTIGAGLEYMVSPRWSLKAEYLYFDLSNNNLSCCFGSSAGRFDDNISMQTVKIGFNFLLHSGLSPLY
jgi:outer membrane immunogenic protein